ncbi:MAG TPA: hypothetical protein VK539_03140 [Myxococcaceae bacterium]|nr:hypothetical protein [Myxococcaceae bacterium]
MADGPTDTNPKKKKRGYSLTAMVINSVVSASATFLATLGVLAGTNSLRTPEEREAATKLEAQNKPTR